MIRLNKPCNYDCHFSFTQNKTDVQNYVSFYVWHQYGTAGKNIYFPQKSNAYPNLKQDQSRINFFLFFPLRKPVFVLALVRLAVLIQKDVLLASDKDRDKLIAHTHLYLSLNTKFVLINREVNVKLNVYITDPRLFDALNRRIIRLSAA